MSNKIPQIFEKKNTVKKTKKFDVHDENFYRLCQGEKHQFSYHFYRSNYEETESFDVLCKLELCKILHFGLDTAQDLLINNVLFYYDSNHFDLIRDLDTLKIKADKKEKIEAKTRI